MPALPFETPETDCRYSTMFHQKSQVPLTDKETIAAEEHLLVYCKPVELYNILQNRAKHKPSFLQRCLTYKIQAKRNKRSRSGTVLFNYRYYNNILQKTEVTLDFTCPFCSVQCGCTKGLRFHLISYHDLFNFEFWVSEKFQAINVSVRTDISRTEVATEDIDPRHQPFFYCSNKRHRKSENLLSNVNHVSPHVLESDIPEPAKEGIREDFLQKDNGVTCPTIAPAELTGHKENDTSSSDIMDVGASTAQTSHSNECAPAVPERTQARPTKLKVANNQKISSEQADPRNSALLKMRQFFHSHKAQPMALEEVYSDCDSEDEVDMETEDFNDGKFLDDFVDVTGEEKHIMHLWNSFVRKQRVLADGHVPWACEAFSRLHKELLVGSPTLLWLWRTFMVKLWNHNLLSAEMMNTCNLIFEKCQGEASDPKQD